MSIATRDGAGKGMSSSDALALAKSGADVIDLLACADRLRRQTFGRSITLASLFSVQTGLCAENCAFCAQASARRSATALQPKPFVPAEAMMERALAAEAAGASEICLVASGTRLSNRAHLSELVRGVELIKANTSLRCGLNLGLMTEADLRTLKAAGADSLFHSLETAASYHPHVIISHSYADELATLERGRRAGLDVCSGGILGMGETWEQRVEFAFELKAESLRVVTLSLFQPMPGTPLANLPQLSPWEALRCLALFRCILPTTPIWLLGGRERVLRGLQTMAFHAGVNGTTVGDYLFTRGSGEDELRSLLADLDLRVQAG